MKDGERFYQKLWFRLYIFPLLAALPFYSQLWAGLKGLFSFLFNLALYFVYLFLFRRQVMPFSSAFAPLNSSVAFMIGWILLYWGLYQLSLFIIVQFILPVNKWEDRKKAAQRIRLFARGKHGAAVFVRNGNIVARETEMDSKKPGVALVDLSSAIVLARHDNAKSWSLPDEDEESAAPQKKPRELKLPWRKNKPVPSFYDAKGPGVVFIEKGQKIDSIVNLRKQTRTSDEVMVYTRNGIKVKSKVSVVFSLSDDPEIFTVGYVDGTTIDHLKILKTKESGNDFLIEGVYDLDKEDAKEILDALNKPPTTAPMSVAASGPYKFDRERVLCAVLSQARKGESMIPWHEAPLEVATDIFRSVIAEVPYDNLFGVSSYNLYNLNVGDRRKTDDSEKSAMQAMSKIRDDFLVRVKLRGMVAFQLIEHLSNSHFYQGQSGSLSSLKKRVPIMLVEEKYNFLRSRGIVIKNATFSEIRAVDEKIQQTMVENWMAKMENEIAISNAEYELEAIRVHNRNRALLQEEMTHLLSGVFQSTPHFDEALALRVLQALETSITEMSDEDMQSIDVYELLKNIHDWILFDETRGDTPDNKRDGNENGLLPN